MQHFVLYLCFLCMCVRPHVHSSIHGCICVCVCASQEAPLNLCWNGLKVGGGWCDRTGKKRVGKEDGRGL